MADPTQPKEAGRFWLPGMNAAAGEKPNWPSAVGRFGLHHAIVDGDTAYCGWRDACLAVVDVSDRSAPRLITHKNWSPPFGGGTHKLEPSVSRTVGKRGACEGRKCNQGSRRRKIQTADGASVKLSFASSHGDEFAQKRRSLTIRP